MVAKHARSLKLVNSLGVNVLLEIASDEGIPPLVKELVLDQVEPRRELEGLIVEHGLELIFRHIADSLDFVGVDLVLDVLLGEEDVVNLVLAPHTITLKSFVVHAGEELEVFGLHISDAELMIELADSSVLGALYSVGLIISVKGMGAAGVGPHLGEGDLLVSPLLEEELVLRVEKEHRESTVEKALLDLGNKMACTKGVRMKTATCNTLRRTAAR
mmetsp:Transcript_29203/g.75180  ORF Transcript_29203/g.75180 Transcript_29203/m.75180 type:complete len:216 (-) Transcript_29203:307-954(-)